MIFLSLLFHIFVLNKLVFTAWPEMLSYPFLFMNNFTLYKDFVMPYPPGLVMFLSLGYSLLGLNVFILKVITWLFIIAIDYLVFLAANNFVKDKTGYILLIFFMLTQSFLDGNMMWFDFATTLPLLISLLFGFKWLDNQTSKELICIGIFLGIAIFIKQIDIVYIPAWVLLIVYKTQKKTLSNLLKFGLGMSTILVPFLMYLVLTNSSSSFFAWSFYYPLTQWSKFPLYLQFNFSRSVLFALLMLFMPLLGFLFLNWQKKDTKLLIIVSYLLSSIIAVYPRFSYFHLQPTIVFLFISYYYIYSKLTGIKSTIFLVVIFFSVLAVAKTTLPWNLGSNTKFYLPEDRKISSLISSFVDPGDRILLMNISSAQYAYTKAVPPKPWIDNFGWYLEIAGIQQWAISGWKKNMPDMIFRKPPLNGNWHDLGVYEPKQIFEFVRSNYQIISLDEGIEVWKKTD